MIAVFTCNRHRPASSGLSHIKCKFEVIYVIN